MASEKVDPIDWHHTHPLQGSTKAIYNPGLGKQSGVVKDSMIKVFLGYRNTDEILQLFKKNELIVLHFADTKTWSVEARPSTAPGLGVCEWSPEGLYDKSVS